MTTNERIKKHSPLDEMENAFFYLLSNNIPLSKVDFNSGEIKRFFLTEPGYEAFKGFTGFRGIVETMHENESLPEHRFFHEQQNISIAKHPRYMPAILHNHNFFEIQFVLSGQILQSVDDINVTLDAGDLCFIAPFAKHCPYVVDDETILINLLVRSNTLNSTFASSLSENDIISEFFLRVLSGQIHQPMLICRTGRDERIFTLILDMLDEKSDGNSYTDKLYRAMMEQLFIYLQRDHRDDFTLGKTLRKKDDTILTILRYIQSNYTEISLPALAVHFNYTETYLSYLIKNYTGRTFSETVIDLRLQKAASLLNSTSKTVSSILVAVGYSDKTHFYRSFHKKYGMTPAEYRLSLHHDGM